MTQPCRCPSPGMCERHSIEKTPHWWKLCRSMIAYRRLWDEGKGPGQVVPLHGPHVTAEPPAPEPLPPCIHRGAQLRVLGCCGEPRKTVYACAQYTECTVRDWKLTVDDDPSGERMGVCEGCQKRQAD